jgi:RNA polymerase sigma-70 factor (sigma-E family)
VTRPAGRFRAAPPAGGRAGFVEIGFPRATPAGVSRLLSATKGVPTLGAEDADDFREFVRGRFEPLRALAYVTCGDWQAAEDAVAGSLAKLYLRWGKVAAPDAYARTMVVRAAIHEKRRPWRRERAVGDAFPDVAGPDPSKAVDERLRLTAALAHVPTRQRAVLVLRFLEGLSVEETAEILGCRPGTVKSQSARGLDTLRAVLAAEDITLHAYEGNGNVLRHPGRVEIGAGRGAGAAHDD